MRAGVASVVIAGCRQATPSSSPHPISWSSGSVPALRAAIDSMADAPEFANAHWGILIVDPERGDTLYARNAGKLFMPASNMKIFTSAVSLTHFGPAYRFSTPFSARGRIADGALIGDLVVTGRGDPSVSDHMLGDAMRPLRAIADSIAARGIRRITGRVVAGGNAFPLDVFGFGWSYDDFEDSYSAPIDELLFNEGFSELRVTGNAVAGEPPIVRTRPGAAFPRVRVVAKTIAAPTDSVARRRANTLRARKDSLTWDVVLDGTIASGDSATIEVTHHDPRTAYIEAVREALRDKGITIEDGTTDTTARLQPLATLSSPPMSEILKALMKPSQNQVAEMLFRATALDVTGVGRPDSARAVEERQIAQWGVAPTEAVIRDGSGLSRYDYISPRATVHVLDAMRKSPHFSAYYDAMPIAGVDGTIRNRMKGTPAERNVHAKTGSVAMARSLSGYVTTANGRMLIFSFLANNWTVNIRAVERVQDAIAARLAALDLR
jgi:D-alanyl-D-alanine carboxypeptidase/D-alanyl-D-alanine-endopeptidase (penicillin-binding protein 4)